MGWGRCILWIELLFGDVRNLNALSFVLSGKYKSRSPEGHWIMSPPRRFDTPPPRWGLLNDRGDIKNSFLVFDCCKAIMDSIILIFVTYSNRSCIILCRSGKYKIRSPERLLILFSPGRWVAPKGIMTLINFGKGGISKRPGGEFEER